MGMNVRKTAVRGLLRLIAVLYMTCPVRLRSEFIEL